MWMVSGQREPDKYLTCDALHHTGKCIEVVLLLYKRRNPTARHQHDERLLCLEDGDMFVVAGDTGISFINPFDLEKPIIRLLEIKEGIASLTQWQNLVIVGTKRGDLIGIIDFSGVFFVEG